MTESPDSTTRALTSRSSGPGRRIAWLLMATGGWLVLLALAAWGLLVDTSLTTNAIANLIKEKLSSAGEVQVGSIEFAPMGREVIIRDFSLKAQDGRVEIERLRLFVGWKPKRGLGIDGIVAEGGSLWISEGFLDSLPSLDGAESETAAAQGIPPVQLDGLALHVLLAGEDWVDMGVLALGAQQTESQWTVQGKLQDTLITRSPLWFHGTVDGDGAVHARAACDAVMLGRLQNQSWIPANLREPLELWHAAGRARVQATLACTAHAEPWDLHLDLDLEDGRAILPPHDLGQEMSDASQDSNLKINTTWTADLRLGPNGKTESFAFRSQTELSLGEMNGSILARGGTAAPKGQLLEVWLDAPRVNWEQELLPRLGLEGTVAELEGMLQPSGEGQALGWLSVPDDAWNSDRPGTRIARQFAIEPLADTSAAYHGDPNWEADGARNLGFPMRVKQLSGTVLHGYTPGRLLPEELGLVHIAGQHSTGPARIEGIFRIRGRWIDQAPPRSPVPLVMLLSIEGDSMEMGEAFYAGLDGLAGIDPIPEIRQGLDSNGGSLDFGLFLQTAQPSDELSTDLDLSVSGVSIRWPDSALFLDQAHGRVSVQVAPVSPEEQAGAIKFDLEGSSIPYATQVGLQGSVMFGAIPGRKSWLRCSLFGINLSDPRVADLIQDTDNRVSTGLTDQLTGGPCSAQLRAWRHSEDAPFTFEALLSSPSSGLTVQIKESQIAPVTLRGSAVLTGTFASSDQGTQGDWSPGDDLRLTLRATSPDHAAPLMSLSSASMAPEEWQVQVDAAGIDLSDPGLPKLVGALGPEGTTAAGFVDASTLFQPGQEDLNATVWLDCETISLPQFRDALGPVRGPVHIAEDGVISSPEIEIGFAGATAHLRDVHIEPNETGVFATTHISAQGIPLEERQLNLVLGEETAQVLIEELNASGLLSVESGTLTLRIEADQPPSVRFDGRVSLKDGSLSIGLPIEVQQMDRSELTLVSEGGRIRVRIKVMDLDASIAGRSLEEATFQATFIEPRLTIEDFSAGFEGGQLASQGLAQAGTASFFSMDLAAPFPFSLSATLGGVDVGLLTRGTFESEFANEGRLKGQVRLTGELGNLLGVRGSGRIELADSSLWAIPVFQVLFATLGFDNTATFGNMESWLSLRDGVITMSGMRLKSDLLSLVGEGTLDLNGELDYSMEVRYSLVDRFGLLNKIIYMLQDELIRISIQGDMGRPVVLARGILSRFTAQKRSVQRLPIPPLSTLPRVW